MKRLTMVAALALALGGCANQVVAPAAAPLLAQDGNPVHAEMTQYRSWLSKEGDLAADRRLADHIVSWQMPHGGFYKLPAWYAARWDGKAARSGWFGNGVELGTIDNGATISEILVLADVYGRTGETAYRDSARRAVDFLLTMQHPSGGLPQVYPARTGITYSNHATFNDNAMIRALVLLDYAAHGRGPLGGDVLTAPQRELAAAAVARGVDFILKAQIVQDGVKTVWCAQHDAVTYQPVTGRSYEHPSKSGLESVLIVAFLMSQPQTPEVAAAARAAVAWYRRDAVQARDTAYDPRATRAGGVSPFVKRPGATMWYRFYDVGSDTPFFSGRLPTDNPPGVGKQYDIMKVGAESRYTYQWGGAYGTRLFAYTDKVGY